MAYPEANSSVAAATNNPGITRIWISLACKYTSHSLATNGSRTMEEPGQKFTPFDSSRWQTYGDITPR
jgi:hypothetical protein